MAGCIILLFWRSDLEWLYKKVWVKKEESIYGLHCYI